MRISGKWKCLQSLNPSAKIKSRTNPLKCYKVTDEHAEDSSNSFFVRTALLMRDLKVFSSDFRSIKYRCVCFRKNQQVHSLLIRFLSRNSFLSNKKWNDFPIFKFSNTPDPHHLLSEKGENLSALQNAQKSKTTTFLHISNESVSFFFSNRSMFLCLENAASI